MSRACACLFALALGACAGGSPLSVELRSDLVPEAEVARFEVELYEGPPPPGAVVPYERVIARARREVDYTAGARVAGFEGLPDGRRWLEVLAIDPNGRVLVRQRADLEVRGPTGRVVVVDRRCIGVECPGAGGSPSDLACLAGRCVDPRCSPSSPEHCPDWATCARDTDCPAPDATCAEARCTDGFCFAIVVGGRCEADAWCNPEAGCTPFDGTPGPGGADAGTPPPPDAGCPDLPCALDDPCHAGVLRCGAARCERVGNLVEGTPCDGGVCDGAGACRFL